MNTPYVWRVFDISEQKLRIVVVRHERINDTKSQVTICVELQRANGMGEIAWHPIMPYEKSKEYLSAMLATLVEESLLAKEAQNENL